jgi:hypothetical protein
MRLERRAEPGHLSDEGQCDQIAGWGSEIDAGATVGLRDDDRTGGLQVEVLGGERDRGSCERLLSSRLVGTGQLTGRPEDQGVTGARRRVGCNGGGP